MASLIEKILQGDQQAVVTLYYEYSPRILRYLIRKLPKDVAQEILNDVFLEAVDSLPTLRNHNNIQSWLYKIALNKTIDYYRKKKIKSLLFSQLPFLELLAEEINQPEFQLEKNKIKEKIETTLHSLSTKYKNILYMHYEEGMQVKEISISLNLSYKATESLLFRARQSFIKAYGRA